MLETQEFVAGLKAEGYSHVCVVPCSFAKNLINEIINSNGEIEYVPCASEAIACSIAAGLRMSGKQPVVIVQSSGLTNMGSCITSLLKPYDIKFPIIVSWRTYKEGDSEIQHAHLAKKLPDLIAAYGYEHELLSQENSDLALEQIKQCENKNKIILLQKNTFSTVKLKKEYGLELDEYPRRSEYLRHLNSAYEGADTLFVGTTGNTAREMNTFMPDTNNFYMAGNMGGALSVGVGASLAGKNVIVCGGDAEFVMHMGGITTAGRYLNQTKNLMYILFDNESNKSTGGQRTYQEHIDYAVIAAASGLSVHSEIIYDLKSFSKMIEQNKLNNQISFVHVKCSYDPEVERPPLNKIRRNNFSGEFQ